MKNLLARLLTLSFLFALIAFSGIPSSSAARGITPRPGTLRVVTRGAVTPGRSPSSDFFYDSCSVNYQELCIAEPGGGGCCSRNYSVYCSGSEPNPYYECQGQWCGGGQWGEVCWAQ